MPEPRLLLAAEVDPVRLDRFLDRFFGAEKAAFLACNGDWWHRGAENRLVLAVGGDVAAYCAVIPTRCRIAGDEVPALWWMDLVVAPEFRGRRLQSLLDEEVRRRAPLLLGFPNELAAAIHRKHGWGVREDLAVLVAPLSPRAMPAVRRARGLTGVALRAGAALLEPAARAWRWRLTGALPAGVSAVEPNAETLAGIASQDRSGAVTTARDVDHFAWRYLASPHREELRVFVAGPVQAPTSALVLRLLPAGPARVLELCGDLERKGVVEDMLAHALAAATEAGASQLTALAASPGLARRLRGAGLPLGTRGRFCWWSEDGAIMEAIGASELHWCLGDSDNDEPR